MYSGIFIAANPQTFQRVCHEFRINQAFGTKSLRIGGNAEIPFDPGLLDALGSTLEVAKPCQIAYKNRWMVFGEATNFDFSIKTELFASQQNLEQQELLNQLSEGFAWFLFPWGKVYGYSAFCLISTFAGYVRLFRDLFAPSEIINEFYELENRLEVARVGVFDRSSPLLMEIVERLIAKTPSGRIASRVSGKTRLIDASELVMLIKSGRLFSCCDVKDTPSIPAVQISSFGRQAVEGILTSEWELFGGLGEDESPFCMICCRIGSSFVTRLVHNGQGFLTIF